MSNLPRRKFVAATVGSMAAAGPLWGKATKPSLCQQSASAFSDQIGSRFSIRDAEGNVRTAKLVSVTEGKQRMPRRFRQPISLIFDAKAMPEQAVCQVSHPVCGTGELLVVPVDPRHQMLEVVLG